MYISTLQSMIRAMGGQLKIEAVFPEGKVEINQFPQAQEGRRGGLRDKWSHASFLASHPSAQNAERVGHPICGRFRSRSEGAGHPPGKRKSSHEGR